MAGIYIHIPFCKQACHYCNFHFSTSLLYKNELVAALLKELELNKTYLESEIIETIYFGGGTPSLCTNDELASIIARINAEYHISPDAEITLEANPDDITKEKLIGWKQIGINRLSIGVQSFFDEDLEWMNRAHNSSQSKQSIELAYQYGFTNISIDLIYGLPIPCNEKWKENVKTAIDYNIPHLSCYALTVEAKTPLHKMIALNKTADVDPDKQSEQFLLLMDWLQDAGYEHYEISNFAKHGNRSKHNSSYWQRKKYLGIGPSAHSFNGYTRQWNVSNNNLYIRSINNEIIPFEKEDLTPEQQLNEYIMTSLRTIEGLNPEKLEKEKRSVILSKAERFINSGKILLKENSLVLTKEGKLLADGIAATFFF